jgi:hypothetical protein
MPDELRKNILSFYDKDLAAISPQSSGKRIQKLRRQLENLRGAAAYSKP